MQIRETAWPASVIAEGRSEPPPPALERPRRLTTPFPAFLLVDCDMREQTQSKHRSSKIRKEPGKKSQPFNN